MSRLLRGTASLAGADPRVAGMPWSAPNTGVQKSMRRSVWARIVVSAAVFPRCRSR